MKLEELKRIREKSQMEMRLRDGKARVKVVVGMGTSGIAAGARETLKAFLEEVEIRSLKDVLITQSGERGLSSHEPVVTIQEEGKPEMVYGDVNPDLARKIIAEHVVNGNPVSQYIIETN